MLVIVLHCCALNFAIPCFCRMLCLIKFYSVDKKSGSRHHVRGWLETLLKSPVAIGLERSSFGA